jgi:hypothetical protein
MLLIPHLDGPDDKGGNTTYPAGTDGSAARDAVTGAGDSDSLSRPWFPDVVVTSCRWPDAAFGEVEHAGLPVAWSPSPADADEARAWLERELYCAGHDPIDLSFMSDEELRELVNDLCSAQAIPLGEQPAGAG